MEYDVVIVPTLQQVESWRKGQATGCEGGLFGVTAATFEAWVADLWELHGDGRALVGTNVREALMWKAEELTAGEGESVHGGLAPLAARCARRAVGVPAFDRAVEEVRAGRRVDALSDHENRFLALIARYEDLLRERGFVEFGEAAAHLAERASSVFPRPLRVRMAQARPLTWVQQRFFSECRNLSVSIDLAQGASGIGKAPQGVDVRFAFPSGRLAQPGLLADIVCALDRSSQAVITCKDPLEMFDKLEERVAEQGRCLRVQATKPFSQTDFGKAFLALHQAIGQDECDSALLSDAAASFFSGFSRSDAHRIDQALRKDRIARTDDMLVRLRDKSEVFSQLERVVRCTSFEEGLQVLEKRVQSSGRSASWRAEQLSALSKLNAAWEASRIAGVDMDVCANILDRTSVAVAVQSAGDGPQVLVTTIDLAANLPQGSFNMVIAADLTSEDYPVAESDDALSTLLGQLGLTPEETALEKARREFTALLQLPSDSVVLSRPLGDANSDETYPAVALEEFIDAYRDDPSNASEVDNAYRLPALLQDGVVERGEELLFANSHAYGEGATQPGDETVAWPLLDDLDEKTALLVAPKRLKSSGGFVEGLCLSPSQIEVYLECPYQWFASRRLKIEAIDEGFGPLERGTFVHGVFEAFYRRFQDAGHLKVTPELLPEARDLMRRVSAEQAERQYELEPGSGRYVAANAIERREVEALCEQLVGYLDLEAQLLPGFHPAYLEYEIDADHAVEYGGCRVVGKVDRIDVDDSGNAVIIDYKGSVNSDHEILGKTEGHCGKVQTRIYAQVVKRMLGLNVVAALYVSYGRTPAVAGAYDPRFVEAAHLPEMRRDKCSCGLLDGPPEEVPDDYSLASLSFDAMLDETEAIVGRAMQSVQQGVISPLPTNPDACRFCPVLACVNRGA